MRSPQQIRDLIRSIPRGKRCHPTCKGWEIFDVNRHEGWEIEACDECVSTLPKSKQPTDDEIASLPEAREALKQTIEDNGAYETLDSYEMDRALSLIAEWVNARKSPKQTLEAIGNALRGAGYECEV